ncbi:hypothetical protein GF327_02170 [Candidatus Woesearchaeota archaeon]|nr:hypothetical protein [Candidatus Woesearchaeota archaeon]
MKKRGEKSLQMIFGLFMLLIISLVVLAMFFRFVKQGTGKTSQELEDWAKEMAIESAKSECERLCNQAGDEASKIEFCSKAFQVDWDEDGSVEGAAQYGQWWFCEKKVPCFVLVDNCKRTYTGHYCRDLLAQYSPNKYMNLHLDVNGIAPDGNDEDYEDGCALPHSNTAEDIPNRIYPTEYNWKERFCFNETYKVVLGSTWSCTAPSIT